MGASYNDGLTLTQAQLHRSHYSLTFSVIVFSSFECHYYIFVNISWHSKKEKNLPQNNFSKCINGRGVWRGKSVGLGLDSVYHYSLCNLCMLFNLSKLQFLGYKMEIITLTLWGHFQVNTR